MACGEYGPGRMSEPVAILAAIETALRANTTLLCRETWPPAARAERSRARRSSSPPDRRMSRSIRCAISPIARPASRAMRSPRPPRGRRRCDAGCRSGRRWRDPWRAGPFMSKPRGRCCSRRCGPAGRYFHRRRGGRRLARRRRQRREDQEGARRRRRAWRLWRIRIFWRRSRIATSNGRALVDRLRRRDRKARRTCASKTGRARVAI